MMYQKQCPNMNHSRSNTPVRYCPNCGEQVGNLNMVKCDTQKHDYRRKERDHYCVDCGKSLKGAL
jgi:hypothetical protein